jgi:DNA modification methylase
VFYCKDAAERFLDKESVDLFIGHPPYYMSELVFNGGDPLKQMQNADSLEQYWDSVASSVAHMEHALKPDGHIFIALENTYLGLGAMSRIASKTSLELQSIRMWDYSTSPDTHAVSTIIFAHYAKNVWGPGDDPSGPYILTNSWEEAEQELKKYREDYMTTGSAPTGLYREMIENFSREGDVVCDLFAGSGTVPLVAIELNRRFIFNDVSEDKLILAKKRIEDYVSERQ